MWDVLRRDVRFGTRTLLKRPGFALVAVLTLGTGIGANTVIFSLVDSVLLRPLPFPEAERLVAIWETAERDELELRGLSYPMLEDLAGADEVLDGVAGIHATEVNLGGEEAPERIRAELVSPAYFRLLGATALVGRLLVDEDDRPRDNAPPVVLSDALWRRRFGASSDVVGRVLRLNEVPVTVVGVAAGSGLRGRAEVFLPLRGGAAVASELTPRRFESRGNRWLDAIGRRRVGVSREALSAWMRRETSRLRSEHPRLMERRGLLARPLDEELFGNVQRTSLLLMAAVGMVLLIACANLASLLLARAVGRRKEMALRRALGATGLQLGRQLLTESLLLATAGGAVGLVLALWARDVLGSFTLFEQLPPYVGLELDVRVLAFTALVSTATALLFGGGPALAAVRDVVAPSLRGGAPAPGPGSFRARELLVSAQVALALALTIGSGLVLKSLAMELRIDPGFRPDNVETLRVQLPERYERESVVRFAEQVVERLGAVPGVDAVAIGSDLPLVDGYSAFILRTEQSLRQDPEESFRVYHHEVTPSFFTTLGIPLVAGRALSPRDRSDAPLVVVVSEKLAARAWPGEGSEGAVGKRIVIGSSRNPFRTVVGVVRDVRYRDLVADPIASPDDPDVYLPFAQAPTRELGVAIAASIPGESLLDAVREELGALDPSLPVYEVRGMDDVVAAETALSKLASGLLAGFGLVALGLAGLGLYGLLTHLVADRSQELGIRLALGASASDVAGLVRRRGLLLVSGGALVGLAGAFAMARYVESFLYGISPTDAGTWLLASGLLLAVALAACAVPARRAARLSPVTLLKSS